MNRAWLLSVVAFSMLLAACNGDDPAPTEDVTDEDATDVDDDADAAGDESADDLVELDVSYLNVSNAANLFVGIEHGYFEEEGLDVTPVDAAAASQLPGLVSGDVDIAFSNPPASILGRSNGLPIQIIAPMAEYSDEPDQCILHVMVPEDSDISSPSDLEGANVAVDTLYQLPHLSVLHAAEAEGADPSAFEYIEIPFPAQIEAAQEGEVDAVTLGEPFLHMAGEQGFERILPVCAGFPSASAATMWVATEDFIAENPDVVERFERAAIRASEHALEDEDDLRATIPDFTPVEPDIAEVIIPPVPATEVNPETFEIFYGLLDDLGQLEAEFDINELFQD